MNEADVILRVGSMSTQATLTACLSDDASTLWADNTPLEAGLGVVMVHGDSCGLANKLLDTLRQAMRKARG